MCKNYKLMILILTIVLSSCNTVKSVAGKELEKKVGSKNVQSLEKAVGGLEDMYNSFKETSIEDERALGESVA